MNPAITNRLMEKSLALILAGGQGTRLRNLTQHRAKPAVPFGGNYRIIDFTISNCANSGIRRIGVLTQYKPHSLISHIQNMGEMLRDEFDGIVELFPVERAPGSDCYSGTADAVYRNLGLIRLHNPDYTVILAGDHIYKMDYAPMLAFHLQNKANLTVGCIKVPLTEAGAFGVMDVDTQNRITGFKEKPTHPDPLPGQSGLTLASTGIYIFNTRFLIEQLNKDAGHGDSSHDFGKDIIPMALADNHSVYAYPFLDRNGENLYWRDVGTVDAYWQTSMDLLDAAPRFSIHDDKEWPLWTCWQQPANSDRRPDMETNSTSVSGSPLTNVTNAHISRSLLFDGVHVSTGTHIRNSVVLPNVTIGKYCHIENAVIDEGSCIPDYTAIGKNPDQDSQRFYISEKGIALVTADMLQKRVALMREPSPKTAGLECYAL